MRKDLLANGRGRLLAVVASVAVSAALLYQPAKSDEKPAASPAGPTSSTAQPDRPAAPDLIAASAPVANQSAGFALPVGIAPEQGLQIHTIWVARAISVMFPEITTIGGARQDALKWHPNGLAIDFENDRLYWCDALLDHIQFSNLDGSNVQTVNTSSLQLKHTFSITIFKEWIYVTDWRIEAIAKVHKVSGATGKVLALPEDGARLFCIKVYSKENQLINPDHPCLNGNGGCEKFCFGVPTTGGGLQAACGCPTGYVLDEDHDLHRLRLLRAWDRPPTHRR